MGLTQVVVKNLHCDVMASPLSAVEGGETISHTVQEMASAGFATAQPTPQ